MLHNDTLLSGDLFYIKVHDRLRKGKKYTFLHDSTALGDKVGSRQETINMSPKLGLEINHMTLFYKNRLKHLTMGSEKT